MRNQEMHFATIVGFLAGFCALTVHAENAIEFSTKARNGRKPFIEGVTNAPDGMRFIVVVKKKWLPDAEDRLARGLPACGEDCLPATGPDGVFGIVITVQKGRFSAGPFSFNGQPLKQDSYTLEIYRDATDVPVEQIAAALKPIFRSTVTISDSN